MQRKPMFIAVMYAINQIAHDYKVRIWHLANKGV